MTLRTNKSLQREVEQSNFVTKQRVFINYAAPKGTKCLLLEIHLCRIYVSVSFFANFLASFRGPPPAPSRTPASPRTTLWEPLSYINSSESIQLSCRRLHCRLLAAYCEPKTLLRTDSKEWNQFNRMHQQQQNPY